jgi:hypothetical protein
MALVAALVEDLDEVEIAECVNDTPGGAGVKGICALSSVCAELSKSEGPRAVGCEAGKGLKGDTGVESPPENTRNGEELNEGWDNGEKATSDKNNNGANAALHCAGELASVIDEVEVSVKAEKVLKRAEFDTARDALGCGKEDDAADLGKKAATGFERTASGKEPDGVSAERILKAGDSSAEEEGNGEASGFGSKHARGGEHHAWRYLPALQYGHLEKVAAYGGEVGVLRRLWQRVQSLLALDAHCRCCNHAR